MNFIKNIFSNPLFHFLILAALIYLVYGMFGVKHSEIKDNTIVVSTSTLKWLEDSWSKRWNRPPTEKEMQGLIDQYIYETVLYKEALKLELDKDDVIIRRRLAQKFEFITDDLIEVGEPTEDELNEYFRKNIKEYKKPDLITFKQIFFDPDKRGESTLKDAEESIKILNNSEHTDNESQKHGDKFFLQSYYPEKSQVEIVKYFGPEFSDFIFNIEAGQWVGPVLSGYGTHIVYVYGKSNAPDPLIDNVKESVVEGWKEEKRSEANEKFYNNLKSRYEIIIESQKDKSN